MTSPRPNLLYQQDDLQEDSYFHSKSSYYKRGNLLATCKGFRARSSSYTSLDDNKQEQNSLETMASSCPSSNIATAFFSRNKKRSNTAPSTFFNDKRTDKDYYYYHEDRSVINEEEDGDESIFFAKNKSAYSRHNLAKPSSWKSSVLRAVGVRSR